MSDGLFLVADAGEALELRGTRIVYKATGPRAPGGPTFTVFEVAPGLATGDHRHTKIEEIFYVLEGEFQIRIGDRTVRARAGDFALAPPGVAHGFGNSTDAPAKLALVISPGGIHEQYFRDLTALLSRPGPPDVEAIGELRRRYDTEQISPLTVAS
jgi:quercetin dioxygenase-like cupin family protein